MPAPLTEIIVTSCQGDGVAIEHQIVKTHRITRDVGP